MSYDIYFVKSDNTDAEQVNELLESETSEGDEHFISKTLMYEVKDALADHGLRFETFEGKEDDYLELNLETYQICMSNSEIAVSLPYWDVNTADPISNEIELISKVLVRKGFTGYDPQTGELFREGKAFSTDFKRVNKEVNEHFSAGVSTEKKSEAWRLFKLGVIFVLAVLLVRLLVSAASKFF